MSTAVSPTFDTLRQYAQEILGNEKRAANDPGGHTGPSSGPWTSVDDGTRPASTGARAAENEQDIKDLPEGDVSVDSTPEGGPNDEGQDKVQYNINMTQSSVGEDPSVEDDYKGTKDDPGTSGPFTVSDSEKYGSWNFAKCASQLGKLGNEILADISVKAAKQNKKADAKDGTPAATPAAQAAGTDAVTKAAQAGYDQAAALGDVSEAEAANRMLYNTVKEASHMADLTVAYLTEYQDALAKRAEADPTEADSGESHEPKKDPADAGPPAAGGPGGGPGGGGPGGDAMAAMLGPGGGPPGADMPPGGDAAAPPPGDPAAGGAPSKEEALHELAAAMIEMGITPEELAQAVAQMQPAQAEPVQKVAQEIKAYRRSGKFEFGPAKTARAKAIRAEMRSFLQELVAA